MDFLLNRKPYSDSAGQIFQAAEQKRIKAVISAISFDTMFYVLRPLIGAQEAINRLQELTHHTEIGVVDKEVVTKSWLMSGYPGQLLSIREMRNR